MKNAVTLKHLFKVVGRKGQALGSEEACIYFDGRHAVGANGEATVSIDCPLQISKPTLIPVSELKTALIANPAQPAIVRASAIEALAALGAPPPAAALSDPDPVVRAAAAISLAARPAPERLAGLAPLLDDPLRAVRISAARGLAEVATKNAFSVGDRLELIHPAGNRELQVERLVTPTGDEISRVPGSDHRVWLPLPPESVGAFVARFI